MVICYVCRYGGGACGTRHVDCGRVCVEHRTSKLRIGETAKPTAHCHYLDGGGFASRKMCTTPVSDSVKQRASTVREGELRKISFPSPA